MDDTAITADVARYYTGKIRDHGATPRGVDWNGAESQEVRFAQLARITSPDPSASLTDVGCGYGGFLPYLRGHGFTGSFTGIDLSGDMIAAAETHCRGIGNARFLVAGAPPTQTAYITASGIFSVKLSHNDSDWLAYILNTLATFDRFAQRGFAFNCLTSYSDKDKMRPDLYYADPMFVFDHCKRAFAKNVALLHDYGLYEFTVLVRK